MRTQPLSLLFVCTANIARSPYAERRTRMLLGTAPVRVASAGTPGYPDRPMDAEMAEQLRLRGGDPSGHVSRCLERPMLDEADIVLTFAFDQQLRIVREWPDAAGRTFGLRQFVTALDGIEVADLDGPMLLARARSAAEPNSMAFDFDDPYGLGRRAARATAREIDGCAQPLASWLTGTPVVADGPVESRPRRGLLWRRQAR